MTRKNFAPSDAVRQMMADARNAFAADDEYAVAVARAGASLAKRRDLIPDPGEATVPAPYTCPGNHPHGSVQCLERHGCRCQVCAQARADKTAERRLRAAERPDARPVAVRRVAPTKTLPAGTVQPGRHVEATRQITSREPVELPAGVLHGGPNSYQHYACRCDECRAWKAVQNKKAKVRAAEKAALQQWHRPDHDD